MAGSHRSNLSIIGLLALGGCFCTTASGQVAQGSGITFPIYYDAHELTAGQTNRLKMLITCTTAELQPNSIWRLGDMHLEHYDGYGRTNLVASSPHCTFNQGQKTVASAAKLHVNANNGLLLLEGVGFFCTFTNTALTLSNNVETRIRQDVGTQLRTNRLGAAPLSGPPGASGTNTLASTNYVTILSDRMSFVYASNIVTYRDNVRVHASQFEMTCQQLEGRRATNGALETIVAQQNVVLFNKADGSSAYGEHAVYRLEEGREIVVLSGERARWQDALREALAKTFSFDLKERRFRAEGSAYFKVPRATIGQQSLFTGAPATRTNAPEGDLEITAETVTAQLPTTNNPARSLAASNNVVIVSATDKSRATSHEAKYSEATGTLELDGDAFWQTGERIISGNSLLADRTNRTFAVNGNAFFRLPATEFGKHSLLSPFLSGRANALSNAPPQFLEMRCDNGDYRGGTLTFREQIRGTFLEGTNAMGAMTCELLLFRFNSNQVESATAKSKVHIEQFPYTSTNGVTVSKSLDCELLNVLLATNGAIQRVIGETNVVALQVEQSNTNALPVASSLRAEMVIGEFFAHTNRLRELIAIRDVALAHGTRKAHGERAVYSLTNNTVELTGNPTADFPDGSFTGRITEAERLIYDLAQKKFIVMKPRAQGGRASGAPTNRSNLPLRK